MKLSFTYHNNYLYEFRYFDSTKRIEVAKAGVWTYTLSQSRSGSFVCNCPGAVYHGKCWHSNFVDQLMSTSDINEPWSQWAEDYEKEIVQ